MFRVPITSRGYVTEVSGTATITGASISGNLVTYTANNSFVPGDSVTITWISPAQFNIHEGIIAAAGSTSFTISNPITGVYSAGGVAKTYYTNNNVVTTAPVMISGNPGEDAKALKLKASRYVIVYDKNGQLKDSEDIVLNTVLENFAPVLVYVAINSQCVV